MAVSQKDSTTITKDESGRQQKGAIPGLIKSKEDKPEKIASKPKLVRINSKPIPMKEFQIESPGAFQGPMPSFICREKYEWNLFFFPQPTKPAMKSRGLRHSSQPPPGRESKLSSLMEKPKKILRKMPDSALKLPPIEKLSLPPSVSVRKSATWPEMASVHLPPITLPRLPKSPSMMPLPKPPLPALMKLRQKYKPTLPLFKDDKREEADSATVKLMDIRNPTAHQEVRFQIYLYFK